MEAQLHLKHADYQIMQIINWLHGKLLKQELTPPELIGEMRSLWGSELIDKQATPLMAYLLTSFPDQAGALLDCYLDRDGNHLGLSQRANLLFLQVKHRIHDEESCLQSLQALGGLLLRAGDQMEELPESLCNLSLWLRDLLPDHYDSEIFTVGYDYCQRIANQYGMQNESLMVHLRFYVESIELSRMQPDLDPAVVAYQSENLLANCGDMEVQCVTAYYYATYLAQRDDYEKALAVLENTVGQVTMLANQNSIYGLMKFNHYFLLADLYQHFNELAVGKHYLLQCKQWAQSNEGHWVDNGEYQEFFLLFEEYLDLCISQMDPIVFTQLAEEYQEFLEGMQEDGLPCKIISSFYLLYHYNTSFSNPQKAEQIHAMIHHDIVSLYGPGSGLLKLLDFYLYQEEDTLSKARRVAEAALMVRGVRQEDTADPLLCHLYENKDSILQGCTQNVVSILRRQDEKPIEEFLRYIIGENGLDLPLLEPLFQDPDDLERLIGFITSEKGAAHPAVQELNGMLPQLHRLRQIENSMKRDGVSGAQSFSAWKNKMEQLKAQAEQFAREGHPFFQQFENIPQDMDKIVAAMTHLNDPARGHTQADLLALLELIRKQGNQLQQGDLPEVEEYRDTFSTLDSLYHQLKQMPSLQLPEEDSLGRYLLAQGIAPAHIVQFIRRIGEEEDLHKRLATLFLEYVGFPPEMEFLVVDLFRGADDISDADKRNIAKDLNYYSDLSNKLKSGEYDRSGAVGDAEQLLGAYGSFSKVFDGNSVMKQELDASSLEAKFVLGKGCVKHGEYRKAVHYFKSCELSEQLAHSLEQQADLYLWQSWAHYLLGQTSQAEAYYQRSLRIQEELLNQVFLLTVEQEQLEYLSQLQRIVPFSLQISSCLEDPQETYSRMLQSKYLTSEVYHLLRKAQVNMEERAQLLSSRPEPHSHQTPHAVREELRRIEAQYFSTLYQNGVGIGRVNAIDVCNALADGTVLLEFTRIGQEEDSAYLAFLVHKERIRKIDLGKARDVDRILAGVLAYIDLYESYRKRTDFKKGATWNHLREKISSPLLEWIPPGTKRLLIAADGVFSDVPFELFPGTDGIGFLYEQWEIGYIYSGKELLKNQQYVKLEGCLVIGGPDFSYHTGGGEGRAIFEPLQGAEQECKIVSQILMADSFVGREARKERLNTPAGLLHIATHAFCDIAEQAPEDTADPPGYEEMMTGIGLVFAGNERMTAKELSSLDLSRTDLVVLSVCSDKLRKHAFLEGALGLRRAFFTAGARSLIVSLWNSDDYATALLMGAFYRYYCDGHSPSAALQIAKNYIRTMGRRQAGMLLDQFTDRISADIYDGEVPFAHPYYWAGFICIAQE